MSSGRRRDIRQKNASASALAVSSMMSLTLLLATTSLLLSTTRAFTLPKARTRTAPNTLAIMSMTEDKTERGKDVMNDGLMGKNGRSNKTPLPIDLLNGDQREPEDSFEIHVGRALDTLRRDYPRILTDQPDFTIFDKQLEVIDPSGVKLHGIKSYKNAFRFLHGIINVFYCPERSGLQYRMCYDTARQNIRVSWNAEVIPKALFGGQRSILHVDGISVYEISRKTGMITQHRIERLIINDRMIQPQQGIFATLRNEHDETVPVFNSHVSNVGEEYTQPRSGKHSPPQGLFGNSIMEFQQSQQSSLFCDSSEIAESSSTALMAANGTFSESGSDEDYPGLDWDAFNRKNASRKKFGLSPLTPEEYLENQAQVQEMDSQQRQRAASASAAAEMTKQSKSRQQNFIEKLFGDVLPESCESNFDCERPQVCCDFGFKQICCSSGAFVGNNQPKYRPAYVPVPVDVYPPGQDPRNF